MSLIIAPSKMKKGIAPLTLRSVAMQLYRPIEQSFCGGCAERDVQSATAYALARLAFERTNLTDVRELVKAVKENTILVSGIGCTGRMPGFFDVFLTWHTTHGRASTVAAGIKMALQGTAEDKTVVVFGGDGDFWAIGAGHTLQATFRDDVPLKLICYDNGIYGMTGGQTSPTTPLDIITSTAPLGNMRAPLDPVKFLMGADPCFLAQIIASNQPEHYAQMQEVIYQALAHPGFAYVHVLGPCHTEQGGRNETPLPCQHRELMADVGVDYKEWKTLSPEEQKKLKPLGLLCNRLPHDYTQTSSYQKYLGKLAELDQARDTSVMNELILKPYNPYLREKRTAIRLGGIAGWGVIGAGEILEKAAMRTGMVSELKEYEATQRGGDTACDIIMSTGEIHSPIVPFVDVLSVLNQSAFDKYVNDVSPQGVIFANVSPGFVTDTRGDTRVIFSPMSSLLLEKVKPPKENLGLNILSLAICIGYTGTIPREAITETVMQSRVGKKNPSLNAAALRVGFEEADRLKGKNTII